MDQLVLEAAEHVLAARCPQVALLIDVDLHVAVHSGAQHVSSYVEFAPFEQEWFLKIFLDYPIRKSDACL